MQKEPDDRLVREALEAMERRDWERLKPLLHPYLHWTDASGKLRGRRNVLAHLASRSRPSLPEAYEVRDGQIYRWEAARSQ